MSIRFTKDAAMRLGRAMPRAGVCLVMLAVSFSAHATLGGKAASVNADQAALGATLQANVGKDYTDYALTLPDHIVVHEFVNASGNVFQVTWSGKGHRPDMSQILGSYATRFTGKTAAHRPTGRLAEHVDTDLVIHSAVHARYFTGSAHVPGMIPETMSGPVSIPVEVK